MKQHVALYTVGCRLNQAESASLRNAFAAKGYTLIAGHKPADIAIVNTCTVTARGDSDTRRLVNKIVRLNPKTHIALIGCQAQTQKEELAQLPNVRLVVGNAKKMNLVDIIRKNGLSKKTSRVIAPAIPRKNFTVSAPAVERTRTRANLKIQDGCNFFCSFCEVPYARGGARSRVFDDILREAKTLVAAGHKEIVITGINVGTYRYKGKTILDVVDRLEKIPELARIRISSIEPTTAPFELITRMGTTKLCRHLHMPLQSGSDTILRAMNRRYAAKQCADFLIKARDEVKGLCIGADIMVGFPGEQDLHFQETLDMVCALPLAYFHTFSYSDRRLNKSRNFKNKVPSAVIQKRSQALRALSIKKRHAFMKQLLGTQQTVLFEQKKNGHCTGLTDNYMRIQLASARALTNQMRNVRCEKISGQTIIARERNA